MVFFSVLYQNVSAVPVQVLGGRSSIPGDEQGWIHFEAHLRACTSLVWGSSFIWAHSLWNLSNGGWESKILISEKTSYFWKILISEKTYFWTLVMSFREDWESEHPWAALRAFRWQRNKVCSLSSARIRTEQFWHKGGSVRVENTHINAWIQRESKYECINMIVSGRAGAEWLQVTWSLPSHTDLTRGVRWWWFPAGFLCQVQKNQRNLSEMSVNIAIIVQHSSVCNAGFIEQCV